MVRGYEKRQKQKINELLYVSWHTALFERQKTLPELKTIIIDDEVKTEKRQQTDEDMINVLKNLTLSLGGEIVEVHMDD